MCQEGALWVGMEDKGQQCGAGPKNIQTFHHPAEALILNLLLTTRWTLTVWVGPSCSDLSFWASLLFSGFDLNHPLNHPVLVCVHRKKVKSRLLHPVPPGFCSLLVINQEMQIKYIWYRRSFFINMVRSIVLKFPKSSLSKSWNFRSYFSHIKCSELSVLSEGESHIQKWQEVLYIVACTYMHAAIIPKDYTV